MPRRGLRVAALLCVLVATARVARSADEPRWPGWLVGRWETTSADGPQHVVFEPDGTLELGGTAEDGKALTDPGGKWEVRDGALIVGDASKGEPTVAFKLERPADEGGRLRLRLVEPGHEATALLYRKALGRPRWLIGTWTTEGAKGAERMILHADGRAIHVAEVGTEVTHVDKGRWEERAGRLLVGAKETAFEIELLAPEEGRVRARFRESPPRDPQLVWTRASWLPKQTYEGPLMGRWDVADAALATAWFFGPYGRYERRRAFASGAVVERGGFQVARGSNGDVLHLESDAGHRRSLDLRVEGPSLRMTDTPRGVAVQARRADGSPVVVAADAIDEAAARADTDATYRFLHDDRHRIGAPAADPHDASKDDPAPGDVFPGMEAFRKPQSFRFESEQVLVRDAASQRAVLGDTQDVLARAVPGSARPRVVLVLSFRPNGRVTESTDTWEKDGTGDPVTVVHHGKYGLQGDVVLVQFEGGPEARWRLGEAGRYLYRGEATFMAVPAWSNMGLDGPKLPW